MSGQRSILLRPLIMIPLCSGLANKSDVLHPRGIIIIRVKYLDYAELALSTAFKERGKKKRKEKEERKKKQGVKRKHLHLHRPLRWLMLPRESGSQI